MAVKVRCGGCEKVLTVPDEARGKAVRCPGCQTKVPVPAGDKPALPKKKATAKPDSSDAIASLDLSTVTKGSSSEICRKCGTELPEESTTCPNCGFDESTGAVSKKWNMKGPDPDDFVPGLFKASWKFVGTNQKLAWRTVMYTSVASVLCGMMMFMFLWLAAWPPKAFFALMMVVCALVIPGWYWYLALETIRLTMERKDKFKRVHFDFFLASALGILFCAWFSVFVLPVIGLPVFGAYLLATKGTIPSWAAIVTTVVCLLPILCLFPVVMAHMAMPITSPGWQIWKVVPIFFKHLKPALISVGLILAMHLPVIGAIATIAAVYGNDLAVIAGTMDDNGAIQRAVDEVANMPKPNPKKAAAAPPPKNPLAEKKPADVAFGPIIVPSIVWLLCCMATAFTGLFSMRVLGQFTYYHKLSLKLFARAKEYKYVAKEKVDEEDEDFVKPLGLKDTAMISGIMILLGLVGGYLYSSLAEAPFSTSLLIGLGGGGALAALVGQGMLVAVGFGLGVVQGLLSLFVPFYIFVIAKKNWNEAQAGVITWAVGFLATLISLISLAASGALSAADAAAAPAAAPPAAVAPGGGPPGGMPPGTPVGTPPGTAPAK